MTTTTTAAMKPELLPTSVRGAPAELRRLIRKRQNSESARRCRLRRKLEAQKEAGAQLTTAQKMARLEQFVADLSRRLAQTQHTIATLIARSAQQQQAVPQHPLSTPPFPQLPVVHAVPRPTMPARHVPLCNTPQQAVGPRTQTASPTVSQHTVSDTDSTIRAAQEIEAENMPVVSERVEVGSPFSEIEFAPATNITDELLFYGALEQCAAKAAM